MASIFVFARSLFGRPKNPYEQVDATIAACVVAHKSKLFDNFGGRPCRAFYLHGDPPFECFQVSIEAPRNDRIAVWAYAIDTNDDTECEMQECWEGPEAELADLLAKAVEKIEIWKRRTRTMPDPPSPS